MPIELCLLVRTWAALDAALAFFRLAPPQVDAGQRLAKPCRRLHRLLRAAGIRCKYDTIGLSGSGKSMLRLRIASIKPVSQTVALVVPPLVAKRVAKACLTMIEVHTDSEGAPFLEYEVDELQAARLFLGELHRQSGGELPILSKKPGCPLAWDEVRQ